MHVTSIASQDDLSYKIFVLLIADFYIPYIRARIQTIKIKMNITITLKTAMEHQTNKRSAA